MQGVLVSVSAIMYTRILASDRIGACPYHPFSNIYMFYSWATYRSSPAYL